MHGKIFQITETRVDKDNYLNAGTFEQGEGRYYDCCQEICEEARKFYIAELIEKTLPKGMFTLVAEDTIRYNGGVDKWTEEFIATIQEKAQAISIENCMSWLGGVHELEEFLKNPLDTLNQFYLYDQEVSDYPLGIACQSYEFLRMVSDFEPGKLLYIGGVIDYHF